MDLIWTAIRNAVTSMHTHARNPSPIYPDAQAEGYGVVVNGMLMAVTLSKEGPEGLQKGQDDLSRRPLTLSRPGGRPQMPL